jgi:hypothetical protein
VVRGYLIDIPTWRQPFSELFREAFIGAAMPAMSRAPEGVAEGGRMGAEGVDGEKGCRKGARLLFGEWMNRRPELSDASTILGGWTVGLVRIKKDQPLLAAKNRGQSESEKI